MFGGPESVLIQQRGHVIGGQEGQPGLAAPGGCNSIGLPAPLTGRERRICFAPGPSVPASGFQDEHRDLPRGLALIVGVGRIGGNRSLPPLVAFAAGDLPGDHLLLAGTILEFDERMRTEVVIPARMGRGAALMGTSGSPVPGEMPGAGDLSPR